MSNRPLSPLAAASQKRAIGASSLKNVISIKKSQHKRKIGEVGGGSAGVAVASVAVDQDERSYCICQSVSYGEMVACDGKVFLLFIICMPLLILLSLSSRVHSNGFTMTVWA
jgi:hypothetical protein